METLFVSGACGFIGSNFVHMILEEHPSICIINYDSLTYAGNLANLKSCEGNERHIFVHGDIRDSERIIETIEKYDVCGIINFAAESHVDRSIEDPNIFIDTNVTGTLNLLKVARDMKLQRFLQVSTDEVYGSLEPDDPAFDENNSIIPSSPYAASKASADHLVHAFNHTFGLNTVITRCSNNYGPYQFPEKMLPLMFNNARHDKDLPVYGDGLQIRDWLYVYDHCTAIWTSFKNAESGSVYNIGGGNEKTNLEVIKAILSFLDKPESLITHVTDRLGHDRRYAINADKAMSELGWKPSVEFEQGLEKTLNWYLDNTEWINSVTSGDYQNYYEQMYANR